MLIREGVNIVGNNRENHNSKNNKMTAMGGVAGFYSRCCSSIMMRWLISRGLINDCTHGLNVEFVNFKAGSGQ